MSATPTLPPSERTARVRLLATTDLHGHLLPYDYTKDQPTQGGGLAGLARLIAQERAQANAARIPVVLLDNGDTFQGTPLATGLAARKVKPDHAIVACLNTLAYDALGLGNHDLDHGLPYLRDVAAALDMPILNSNLRNIDRSPLHQSLLLPVDLGASAPGPLTLGILSVLPSMSAAWNSHHLGSASMVEAPEIAAAVAARGLKAAGADLVVVLAHMGVGMADGADSDERAGQALARTGQIDALILGHTHRRLPSPDYAARPGVDIRASTLAGVPALMPGHAGSDLGVMELDLVHDPNTGWRIASHRCTLRPNGVNVLPDPKIVALATPQHNKIRSQLRKKVAATPRALHSFFSVVSPAPTQQLTAQTHFQLVSKALAGTSDASLPVLAASAAHGAGGRDGVENYIYVPKGDVLERHLAGLNPFANQVVGIHITGAQLRRWLEHSAALFNTLAPNQPEQMLVNADIPTFQFDTIFGLNYAIDPGAPPHARITDLRYAGLPVAKDQDFILATNQFRVAGGGGYAPTPAERVAVRVTTSIAAGMIEALASCTTLPWQNDPPWHFAPARETRAIILTHPDAMDCISEIAHLRPALKGTTPDGFIRLCVTL